MYVYPCELLAYSYEYSIKIVNGGFQSSLLLVAENGDPKLLHFLHQVLTEYPWIHTPPWLLVQQHSATATVGTV